MKSKSILNLIIFLLVIDVNAQWYWQNPLPQGNALNTVCFVDSMEGWTAGYFGTLMHTLDGGVSWEIVPLGTIEYLNDISFVSAEEGWIVGYGVLYHTEDGGENWGFQDQTGKDAGMAICFVDEKNGWIVGSNYHIRHTEDGGESWAIQENPFSGNYGWFFDVFFLDSLTGWCCGDDGAVLYTNDGGNNWQQQYNNCSERFSAIYFINPNIGWAAAGCGILRTTNGGNSWQTVTPIGYLSGNSIYFADALNGWVCGNIILRTSDGGLNWEVNAEETGSQMHFSDPVHGWVVGAGGRILSYDDSTAQWTFLSEGSIYDQHDVFFLNDNEGWVAGRVLQHTVDGGANWEEQFVDDEARVYSVQFINESLGWAAGDGSIYRSVDGGENWDLQYQDTAQYFWIEDLFFADSLHGWVLDFYAGVLDTCHVLHTRNGGVTWEVQFSGLEVQHNAICAHDSLTAWIAGGYGWISRTTDGGITWVPIHTGYPYHMNWDIQFIDPLHGWLSDGPLHTEDGGNTWQNNNSAYEGFAIHFIDLDNGWLCSTGSIFKTTNGGISWETQNQLTNHWLFDICFVDENEGWAVGDYGTILHTDNGGVVEIDELEFMKTDNFTINSYPNPTKSISLLEFEIEAATWVKLSVYNNQGQQVELLLDQQEPSGQHRVTWNAEKFPPGVYFCHISAGRQSASCKVVVIK